MDFAGCVHKSNSRKKWHRNAATAKDGMEGRRGSRAKQGRQQRTNQTRCQSRQEGSVSFSNKVEMGHRNPGKSWNLRTENSSRESP